MSLARAAELIHSWVDRKIVRLLGETRNHVSDVIQLLTVAGSSGGNLVVDAQIAAVAMAHNATVHTADRDFSRFAGLKCHFPLDE
jgi:predicted nucleic acid-binding protein